MSNPNSTPPYLVSCNDHSNTLLRYELELLGYSVEELASGVILATPQSAKSQPLPRAAAAGKLVFGRHLFAVQFDSREGDSAIPELFNWLKHALTTVTSSAEAPLGVQLRFVASDIAFTAQQLAADLEAMAVAAGVTLRRKAPAIVCSVLVVGARVLAGFSPVAENLSSWAGGAPRYRASPQQISRADGKLTEALEISGFTLPPSGRALDVGAAPGGWAQLLSELGLTVAAVDPAELDPRLREVARITHYQQTLEDFIAVYSGPYFDLLVNDMRRDPLLSASDMGELVTLLAPGACGIMTAKLPELEEMPAARVISIIAGVCSRLSERFKVGGVRQLFHNRNEVTVWFQSQRR